MNYDQRHPGRFLKAGEFNGKAVTLGEAGRFEPTVQAHEDGPFSVRVVCGEPGVPATVVERHVEVDGSPPRLVMVEPEEARCPPNGCGCGFHAVACPVFRSTAANSLLGCPPMLVKPPLTYKVPPLTSMSLIAPTPRSSPSHQVHPGSGSQSVASPVVASTAAKLFRVCPPILVK